MTQLAAVNSPPSPYLTVKETASFLGVSRRTVYNLIQRGQLPTCRLGTRLRFDRRELEACLRGMSALDLRRQQRRRK